MSKLTFFILACTLLSNNSFADEPLHHEISYGIIDLDSFGFGKTTNFPVIGATYRYTFDGLDGGLPSNIESHIKQKSWVQYDANLILELSPSINGQYYFDGQYNIKYGVTYLNGLFDDGDSTLLTELVLNKRLTKHWQAGVGITHSTHYDDEDSYQYSSFSYEDEAEFQFNWALSGHVRYTNIKGNRGWDIEGQISQADETTKLSAQATFVQSKKSSFKGAFWFLARNDRADLFSASISKEYRFSNRASFDIGVGNVWLLDSGATALLIDLNGSYRF